MRMGWVGVLVFGGNAIDGATTGRSEAVVAVATWGAGVAWLLGVAAMAIPAVISLTATRILVPLSIPATTVAWVAGAETADAALSLGIAAFTTMIAFSGEIGRSFVQASAYGDEDRNLLRPPAAYLLAVLVTWALWAASVVSGPLLLAARSWVVGVVVSLFGVGAGIWAWPRWHRSRGAGWWWCQSGS